MLTSICGRLSNFDQFAVNYGTTTPHHATLIEKEQCQRLGFRFGSLLRTMPLVSTLDVFHCTCTFGYVTKALALKRANPPVQVSSRVGNQQIQLSD